MGEKIPYHPIFLSQQLLYFCLLPFRTCYNQEYFLQWRSEWITFYSFKIIQTFTEESFIKTLKCLKQIFIFLYLCIFVHMFYNSVILKNQFQWAAIPIKCNRYLKKHLTWLYSCYLNSTKLALQLNVIKCNFNLICFSGMQVPCLKIQKLARSMPLKMWSVGCCLSKNNPQEKELTNVNWLFH